MIKLTNDRLGQLGAKGLVPPLAFSERYHGGVDPQLFQKWDGSNWTKISDWIMPYEDIVWAKIKESAKAYKEQTKGTAK
jgi:branched-chain amino acid transport system substrate-binding protein